MENFIVPISQLIITLCIIGISIFLLYRIVDISELQFRQGLVCFFCTIPGIILSFFVLLATPFSISLENQTFLTMGLNIIITLFSVAFIYLSILVPFVLGYYRAEVNPQLRQINPILQGVKNGVPFIIIIWILYSILYYVSSKIHVSILQVEAKNYKLSFTAYSILALGITGSIMNLILYPWCLATLVFSTTRKVIYKPRNLSLEEYLAAEKTVFNRSVTLDLIANKLIKQYQDKQSYKFTFKLKPNNFRNALNNYITAVEMLEDDYELLQKQKQNKQNMFRAVKNYLFAALVYFFALIEVATIIIILLHFDNSWLEDRLLYYIKEKQIWLLDLVLYFGITMLKTSIVIYAVSSLCSYSIMKVIAEPIKLDELRCDSILIYTVIFLMSNCGFFNSNLIDHRYYISNTYYATILNFFQTNVKIAIIVKNEYAYYSVKLIIIVLSCFFCCYKLNSYNILNIDDAANIKKWDKILKSLNSNKIYSNSEERDNDLKSSNRKHRNNLNINAIDDALNKIPDRLNNPLFKL